MFLPYGTGALLVRDGSALRAVHAATAGYLPAEAEAEFYDPAQHGPELSRGFPGLRVWLSVKMYGAARYRAAIAEKRALALWAAERVAEVPGIVMDARRRNCRCSRSTSRVLHSARRPRAMRPRTSSCGGSPHAARSC